MISQRYFALAFVAVFLFAAWLRLDDLSSRPMHGDEAVHAVKFGELLEHNRYVYDFHEYHGPTLNYFTLIPAWFSAKSTFATLDETTVRSVPVFFGLLLILLLFPLRKKIGFTAVVFAGLFTAISPAMVFYSRYYIQEMLLVCFAFATIIAGFLWLKSGKWYWVLGTGAALGLMHATKETCVINFFTFAVAGFALWLRGVKPQRIASWQIALALIAMVAVSMLFFSSFGTNPKGIWDSIYTYSTYFERGTTNEIHIHPWTYYFKMLLFFQMGDGLVWSEGIVIFLGCTGGYFAFRKADYLNNFMQFMAIYTLTLLLIYAVIPYKTPWNLLSFYHGFIILAGYAVQKICQRIDAPHFRIAYGVSLSLACVHLLWQTQLANTTYRANPQNPHVYGHPLLDVYDMQDAIEAVAQAQPDSQMFYIHVAATDADYWPLPWYLRHIERIGWWSELPMDEPNAPLFVISADLETQLAHKLYEVPPPGQRPLYVPVFEETLWLRPQVELKAFARKDVWDRWYYQSQDSVQMPQY